MLEEEEDDDYFIMLKAPYSIKSPQTFFPKN